MPRDLPLAFVPLAMMAALSTTAQAAPATIDLSKTKGLVDAQTLVDDMVLDFRYASKNNFVGEDVYGDFKTCFLQKDAAQMLQRANAKLKERRADLVFIAFDCLRPRSVQLRFWDKVKGTKQQSYVANPHSKTGSIHNYGCAIDLSLATKDGKELDMGTAFDHFGPLAHPAKEAKYLANGKLTHAQVANRLLLREVMVAAGFYPLNNEWWHFNCATSSKTRAKYKIVP